MEHDVTLDLVVKGTNSGACGGSRSEWGHDFLSAQAAGIHSINKCVVSTVGGCSGYRGCGGPQLYLQV